MRQTKPCIGYPSNVSDDEWEFIAPYLRQLTAHALPRRYDLRTVFTAVRYVVRTGSPRRILPNDPPSLPGVYQQARRWIEASCFEVALQDLRLLLRVFNGRRNHSRRNLQVE